MICNQLNFRNAAPARYPLALPFSAAGENPVYIQVNCSIVFLISTSKF
jgi:hypothetical protein